MLNHKTNLYKDNILDYYGTSLLYKSGFWLRSI